MTKIEEGLKLDFNNVLIRPKRSTINSRSNVNLMRNIKFKNCKSLKSWEGIPIIASNMDTVGTFDVYKTLSKFKIITALHKFYTVADFISYQSDNNIVLNPDLFMVSTGIQETDFTRLKEILSIVECNWICRKRGYSRNCRRTYSQWRRRCCQSRDWTRKCLSYTDKNRRRYAPVIRYYGVC